MRNTISAFYSTQPDPHMQIGGNQQNRIQKIEVSTPHRVNNPSTLAVQDFANLSARNLKANVLLNSDDDEQPIHQKNPTALLKAIDDNVTQTAIAWGRSKKDVEDMIGSSTRIMDPVCGVSANNLMKLFLDSDHSSYVYAKAHPISLSQLQQQFAHLPADKNFILRVKDSGLGHAYVIDLPASAKSKRDAFIYQSDLGEGAARPLRLEDWMNKKASYPVSLNDLENHFINMSNGNIDPEHIAKLFDIDSNPKMLRPERLDLRKNKGFNFQLAEYDLGNLERNINAVKANCI
ncbi:cell division protein [[Pantoea] beijingensis]|uniref:Cell division protein n=1 Tax=[Pantoea] beijingensis TaxID=1324864 RepID=A0A443IH66_9GAMM|nr:MULTISPECIES: cycle-inhibiting factor [Erwiniaceae]RWR03444.1 cell division protein [[Pantoea] beijingensis]